MYETNVRVSHVSTFVMKAAKQVRLIALNIVYSYVRNYFSSLLNPIMWHPFTPGLFQEFIFV